MVKVDRNFRRYFQFGPAIAGIVTLLWISPVVGQEAPPDLKPKYFSRQDGLTNSYIYQVLRDSTGYIWVASRDGLFRYNGYHFSSYRNIAGDSTSLPDNGINCLYVDSQKQLWIGTNQGICRYDESMDQFIRVAWQQHMAGMTGLSITQIFEDEHKNLYTSNGNEVYRYDGNLQSFKLIFSLKDGSVNFCAPDGKDHLWIACSEKIGLVRFGLKDSSREIIDSPGNKGLLQQYGISRLVYLHDTLWMSTLGGGVMMLETNSRKLTLFPYFNKDDAMVAGIYTDRHNNIWSVDYTGLKFFNRSQGIFYGYYPNPENPGSIRANVKGIYQDNQGIYWLYHEPGSVGICIPQKGFSHYTSNTKDFWHTSLPNVTAVQEDPDGNLWLGYHQGGIDVFNWKKNSTTHFSYNEKNKNSLGRGSVLCIYKDSQGRIWTGTYFDGLQLYDPASGKFTRFKNNPEDTNSIAGNDIRSITEDKEHNFWISIHSKGVDKLDLNTLRFTHFNNQKNNLSNNWTTQILTDVHGDIWVASAWGVSRLKKGENRFTFYVSDPKDSTTLTNSYIVSLYEDSRHYIWAGTSSGLNCIDEGSGKCIHPLNQLKNEYISSIIEDNNGHIWAGSLSGIYMIRTDDWRISNFTTADGLLSQEFNGRAVIRTSEGKLIFGGTSSVEIFNPQDLRFNIDPPQVIIEHFRILSEEILPSNSEKLEKTISHTGNIRLSYKDKMISIEYAALNFINPQLNHYAYMMEGFEKRWNDAGTNRMATYTNLSPGTYVFRVMAANNDGVWSNNGAKLTIIILPPWYGTWWFKLLLGLIAMGMITGFVYLRTSSLRRQRILLKKNVNEKTAELSRMNRMLQQDAVRLDEVNKLLMERQEELLQQSEELRSQSEKLGFANEELKKLNDTKDKLFAILAHDLVSPFGSILGFSGFLMENFNGIEDSEKLKHVGTINKASQKLYGLLQNLLFWAQSQTSKLNYHPTNIKMTGIISETADLRNESLIEKNIHLQVTCPEQLYAWADPDMIKAVLRNLLGNAIKFTPPDGNIDISAWAAGQEVFVAIRNTGEGITKEKMEQILSTDLVDTQPGTEGERGHGLGLQICKTFLSRNYGRLMISSIPGSETTFSFSIPADKNGIGS